MRCLTESHSLEFGPVRESIDVVTGHVVPLDGEFVGVVEDDLAMNRHRQGRQVIWQVEDGVIQEDLEVLLSRYNPSHGALPWNLSDCVIRKCRPGIEVRTPEVVFSVVPKYKSVKFPHLIKNGVTGAPET